MKKSSWIEYTKEVKQQPIAHPNFSGILFVVHGTPLCRIGFTTTKLVSSFTKGLPVIVPLSGSLQEAPEFIIKLTNTGLRVWVKKKLEPPKLVTPN